MTAPTTPSPERQPADAGGGLLPCPFCGSASISEDGTECTDSADYIWFTCTRCGVESEGEHGRDAALAQWNRRSPAPQAQPDARAVEAILRQHIKCDATGLAPAVASVYLTGFKEAAEAVSRLSAPAADDGWRPTREEVARAIEEADRRLAYGMELVHLVDGDHTYTLKIDGETLTFTDSDTDEWNAQERLYAHIAECKNRIRADAILALHPAAPTDTEVGK